MLTTKREAGQVWPRFGLRGLFLTVTGISMVMGVLSYLGLAPPHVLVAFGSCALTAGATIFLVQIWR